LTVEDIRRRVALPLADIGGQTTPPRPRIYERWIAKFEKPRLKALSDLKRRLEKANG
jgi:hypothetical protein